jgi:GT2 family glycosyltransferase
MEKEISVIIPTMKGREKLLERLKSTIPKSCQIVVVGGDMLLAAKRNEGAKRALGDYLVFVDDDNYFDETFGVEKLVARYKDDPSVGVLGAVSCYDDDKLRVADGGSDRNYSTGFMKPINTNKRVNHIEMVRTVDEVANCFVVQRALFWEIGGFDEKNFPIDLDEADLCKRVKNLGGKVKITSWCICYHKSQTYSRIPDFRRPLNAYFMGRNKVLFQKKHSYTWNYYVYLALIMPINVVGYTTCMLLRLKPQMAYWYIKGTIDGISGRKENRFQQS